MCVRWGIMISPPGEALSFGVGPKPMEIELPFIQNGGNFGQSPFWSLRSVIGESNHDVVIDPAIGGYGVADIYLG